MLEDGDEFGMIIFWFGTRDIFYFFASEDFKISETADGILAVERAVGTEFVENFRFFEFRESFFITQPNGFEILFFRLWTHKITPFVGLPFNMSQRFSLNVRSVTFNLIQFDNELVISILE